MIAFIQVAVLKCVSDAFLAGQTVINTSQKMAYLFSTHSGITAVIVLLLISGD